MGALMQGLYLCLPVVSLVGVLAFAFSAGGVLPVDLYGTFAGVSMLLS